MRAQHTKTLRQRKVYNERKKEHKLTDQHKEPSRPQIQNLKSSELGIPRNSKKKKKKVTEAKAMKIYRFLDMNLKVAEKGGGGEIRALLTAIEQMHISLVTEERKNPQNNNQNEEEEVEEREEEEEGHGDDDDDDDDTD